jgi:beta-glucosidase
MASTPFPSDFIWGASTSAYQIEGAIREDGRSDSIWDTFCRVPGRIADGSSGRFACDHYHRYPEDIAIMRELGLNTYRFSIAWPRVLPKGWGAVNKAGLDFYDRLVDELLAAGIQPLPTLFHFDLPSRLENKGGFLSRDIPKAMAEYADIVSRRLGDRIERWMTVNEPWIFTYLGYALGVFAPGHQNWAEVPVVGHHMLLSHAWAMQAIRTNIPDAKITIGLPLSPVYPGSDHERDLEASIRQDGLINRMWLDPLHGRGYPADVAELFGDDWPEIDQADLDAIASPVDWLGVNYYYPTYVVDDPSAPISMTREAPPSNLPVTGPGWPVQPSALTEILTRLHTEYGVASIVVTENGAAFDDPPVVNGSIDDQQRARFLHDHLEAVLDAIEQGVRVDGYCVWSLLDNFEWASGYNARFGLVGVDYETQGRTIKQSGRWYAKVIEENGLVPPG